MNENARLGLERLLSNGVREFAHSREMVGMYDPPPRTEATLEQTLGFETSFWRPRPGEMLKRINSLVF